MQDAQNQKKDETIMSIPFRFVNEYFDEDVALVKVGEYQDGTPALEVYDAEGENFMRATTCIPGTDVPEGHVLIKNWGENDGLLQSLMNAGVVGEPVRTVPAGYTYAHLCELLKDI